jgi:hypothetical protein
MYIYLYLYIVMENISVPHSGNNKSILLQIVTGQVTVLSLRLEQIHAII